MARNHPKALQAQAMLQMGGVAEALAIVERALKASPADPDLHHIAAVCRTHLGPLERAEFHARRAVALRPGEPAHERILASILTDSGRDAESVELLRRAHQRTPHDLVLMAQLVNTMARLGLYDEALALAMPALDTASPDPELAWAVGYLLTGLARADEAAAVMRRALAADPLHFNLASRLAMTTIYDHTAGPAEVLSAHRAFGAVMDHFNAVAGPPPRIAARSHPGPLRLGFISADLRTHSVAYFLEPLLEAIDPARLAVTCFAAGSADETTRRLRSRCAGWVTTTGHDAESVAQLIRDAGIDVLIELSGHTSGNALASLARSPAPVIATWLGYPATTGVATVQHRLVDSITDPPGSEPHCVERLVRLDPCFICYRPDLEAMPKVASRPSAAGRPPTFGSFNNFTKFNPRTLDLWSRVLQAVPGSRLVLKSASLTEPAVQARVRAMFASRGIEAGRIEPLPKTPTSREHLSMYSRVDVALDTFPYNGTTTTCEALCMGVPVVTLRGTMHAGRVGASLLSAAGLPDLIAESDDAYVTIAARLAADGPRLDELRATLRDRVAASPLCDKRAFAGRFTSAVERLWTDACNKETAP